MPADDETKPGRQRQPEPSPEQQTAEEDQFTKASAIAAARSFDASPHEMAGALWDKADDDPVTRQEAADAVAKLREGPDEEG